MMVMWKYIFFPFDANWGKWGHFIFFVGDPVPRSLEGLFVYEEKSPASPANDTIVVEQWTVIEVSRSIAWRLYLSSIHSVVFQYKYRWTIIKKAWPSTLASVQHVCQMCKDEACERVPVTGLWCEDGLWATPSHSGWVWLVADVCSTHAYHSQWQVIRCSDCALFSFCMCITVLFYVFVVREILPLSKWCSCRGLLNPLQSDRTARYGKDFLLKLCRLLSRTHLNTGTVAFCFCLLMCLRVAALGERRPVSLSIKGWEQLMQRSSLPLQGELGDSLCLEVSILAPCHNWRMVASSRTTGQLKSPVCDRSTQRTMENWIQHAQRCAVEKLIFISFNSLC